MLIIPNEKMPECCFNCPCEQESVCGATGKSIDYDKKPSTKRMQWCPLIEKPDNEEKES